MSQPTLTVSGYRGIWGESLTIPIAERFARAFSSFLKERNPDPIILIGRDGRESGKEIKEAVIAQFRKCGVSVIDGDILPTPTVLFAVRTHNYDGALIITASHNPIEYNGLKFVMGSALFANEEEIAQIQSHYDADDATTSNEEAMLMSVSDFPREHADHILKFTNVDAIRARKLKAVVDMTNASACVLDPYLFKQLGVELIAINDIPNGKFTHMPEPKPENLTELSEAVRTHKADIGFAQDPDADRLVVANEHGEIISEELTLALGIEYVLSHHPGSAIAINMSTSQANCDIAEKYGGKCIRTKVGEAYVTEGILENNAIIGGEGTGSSIFPTINTARDSFVSLMLVFGLMSERKQTVSECVASLPQYVMRKDKMPRESDLSLMYAKMKSHFTNIEVNELDGLRLDFSDSSWIHLRPSNTEPIVRLYGEAKTKERIDALFEETKSLFI